MSPCKVAGSRGDEEGHEHLPEAAVPWGADRPCCPLPEHASWGWLSRTEAKAMTDAFSYLFFQFPFLA